MILESQKKIESREIEWERGLVSNLNVSLI